MSLKRRKRGKKISVHQLKLQQDKRCIKLAVQRIKEREGNEKGEKDMDVNDQNGILSRSVSKSIHYISAGSCQYCIESSISVESNSLSNAALA